MQISSTLHLLPLLALVLVQPATAAIPKCDSVSTRYEWRSLSSATQQKYLKAVVTLQKQTGEKPSVFDSFAKAHGELAAKDGGPIHGSSMFLPWHRYFLRLYEIELQNIEKGIMQPYWAWQLDSQAPEKAPIWGDDLFGGNGSGSKKCVTTGKFKDWQPMYPKKGCLQREWDGGAVIGSFFAEDQANMLLSRATKYEEAEEAIEYDLHASPHNNIGGHMSSMYSPNDPIFYLHHANVDKFWADWQKLKPEYQTAYGGSNKCPKGNCPQATADDTLATYTVKVKDVFDTTKLCYKYADPKDTEVAPVPPPPVLPPAPKPGPEPAPGPDKPKPGPDKPEPGPDKPEPGPDKPKPGPEPAPGPDKPKPGPDKPEPGPDKPKPGPDKPTNPGGEVKVTPYDGQVTSEPAPKDKESGYVPDDDRLNLNYIRVPDPIKESWLVLNGIDVTKTRKLEVFIRNSTLVLNRVPGYVSPNALWNSPKLVEKLYNPGTKFNVELNGVRVQVAGKDKDGLQAYSNMKERIERSVNVKVQADIETVATKVVKLLGPPLRDEDSPFNVFKARHKGQKGFGRGSFKREAMDLKPITDELDKVGKGVIDVINEFAKLCEDHKDDLRGGKKREHPHFGKGRGIVKKAGDAVKKGIRGVTGLLKDKFGH